MAWRNLKKPLILLVALSAATYILGFAGYMITSFLLMFTMFFIYDRRRWYIHILASAVTSVLTFFIFYKLLGVQLPIGAFNITW